MNLDKVRPAPNPSPAPGPGSGPAPRPRRKVASIVAGILLVFVLLFLLALCWVKIGSFGRNPDASGPSLNSSRSAGATDSPSVVALPATVPELIQLANAGDARACFELGERYRHGRGAIKDEQEAFNWYVKAAGSGDAEISFRLGVMFDAWQSEFSTSYRVFSHLEAAALCGHQYAQLKLAALNLRNTRAGGSRDAATFGNVVDAYAWLNICAAWGDEASVAGRDELEVEIKRTYTPATLTQCQARSRQILKIIESNKTSATKVTVLPAREN